MGRNQKICVKAKEPSEKTDNDKLLHISLWHDFLRIFPISYGLS